MSVSEQSGATAAPEGRGRVLVGVGTFVVAAGISLISMAFRPIESTVLFGLCGLLTAVVAARSPQARTRRGGAGATLGILAVLTFYWASALINMEPDVVVGHVSI